MSFQFFNSKLTLFQQYQLSVCSVYVFTIMISEIFPQPEGFVTSSFFTLVRIFTQMNSLVLVQISILSKRFRTKFTLVWSETKKIISKSIGNSLITNKLLFAGVSSRVPFKVITIKRNEKTLMNVTFNMLQFSYLVWNLISQYSHCKKRMTLIFDSVCTSTIDQRLKSDLIIPFASMNHFFMLRKWVILFECRST